MKFNSAFLTHRNLVLVSIFFLFSASKLEASSVFSKGNWYKFTIDKQGVYKLDYNFLVNELNVKPQELSIATIGVFGYGGGALPEFFTPGSLQLRENNIEIIDINNNGVLEKEDYILW
jgi:hypothetical protein